MGHQLPADHGTACETLFLFGGRCLEPQSVAWDVAEVESAQIAADLVQRAFLKELYHPPTALAAASASSRF